MTKEEKQLLLKELCARLLYGVKGRYCLYDSKGNLTDFGNEPEIVENIDLQKEKIWTDGTVQGYYLDEFKIYLRPMDSMTEEEYEEYEKANDLDTDDSSETLKENMRAKSRVRISKWYHGVDWLNAHHFDYRGLIEKGLALEAQEGMYKN